jgi:hypothetical protein
MGKYKTPAEIQKIIEKQDAEVKALLAKFDKMSPGSNIDKWIADTEKIKGAGKAETD